MLAVLRYADALVTGAAFATMLLLVVIIGAQSSIGLALLPFLVMSMAVGSVSLHRMLVRRVAGTSLADYYATCLLVLHVLALLALYLGGNYLVVREGNAALHELSNSAQIPFAWVFYLPRRLFPCFILYWACAGPTVPLCWSAFSAWCFPSIRFAITVASCRPK